ncbi:hypothetical protein VTL71DRAFT_9776 [Oculimacula yallundae]|uniref:Uncharacterized protein n=1 Tax=Oculimacula yallundae TaxID=86028 RepID=A0ABR4BT59_9HELO
MVKSETILFVFLNSDHYLEFVGLDIPGLCFVHGVYYMRILPPSNVSVLAFPGVFLFFWEAICMSTATSIFCLQYTKTGVCMPVSVRA